MRPVQNYTIPIDPSDVVTLSSANHDPVPIDCSPERPDYVTTDGVEVWIERKRIRTRFLDADGNQVGPWHTNLAPALIWARYHGWIDPTLPDWFNEDVIAEVRAGGASAGPYPEGAS